MDNVSSLVPSVSQTLSYSSGKAANENLSDHENQGKKSTENNEENLPPSVPSSTSSGSSESIVSSLEELEHGNVVDPASTENNEENLPPSVSSSVPSGSSESTVSSLEELEHGNVVDPASTENNEENLPPSVSSSVPSGSSESTVSSLEELEHGNVVDPEPVKETKPIVIRKIRKPSRKPVEILSYDTDDEAEKIIDQVGGKYDSNQRIIRKFLKQSRTTKEATPKSSQVQMTGIIVSSSKAKFDGKSSNKSDPSSNVTLCSRSDTSDEKYIGDLYSDFRKRRLRRQVKKVLKKVLRVSLAVLCTIIVIAAVVVIVDSKTLLEKWGITKRSDAAPSPTGSQDDPATETPSESPMKSIVDAPPTNSPSTSPVDPSPTASPSGFPSSSPSVSPTYENLMTTFYVIGDLPYNDNERTRLIEHVNNLPDDAEFLIHVGDMRNADEHTDCLYSEFDDVGNILKKSKVPVFIVPGDNEYNECPNFDISWKNWLWVFGDFEVNWSSPPLNVTRDVQRPENFFFVHKRVLYIGLNIVGGERHSYSEWEGRLSYQFLWTKDLIETHVVQSPRDASSVVIFAHADPRPIHSSFFGPLQLYIANKLKNEIPIIYVNGDKHYFQFDPAWYGQESLNRVMVEGGSTEPPLQMKLSVPSSPDHDVLRVEDIYTFDRQL